MDKVFDAFFDELYSEYYKDLFKYAYRLTYEKNMAEEIVQDTFIEAYKKIELLAQHENPAGWLYVTTRNIIKAYMREYLSIKTLLPLEDHEIGVADEEREEIFLSNYLNEQDAKIIFKFYVEKRSLTEISEEYAISLSACKMRIKRAREKFKEIYEKEK